MAQSSFFISPLHTLSSWGLTFGLIVVMLVPSEAGFRVGRARHERVGDAGRGHFNAVQASLLALLALLLGFTLNMANGRFDARRQGVIDTANNFAALHLRSGELPEAPRSEFQQALRESLALQADAELIQRDVPPTELIARTVHAEKLHRKMWAIVSVEAQVANPLRAIEALAGQLTEAESLLRRRVFAYLNRVPEHILILLYSAAICAAGVVGYSAGLGQHHGRLQSIALAVFVCGTIHVILELDRPISGVQVDHTPLLHLREQWGRETTR